jgi:anaerobic selenocysteine-containing dehydrogenase
MDEQAKLSRRSILRGAVLLASGTLAAAVIQVKPAYAQKAAKEATKYQDSPKDGQKCSDCAFFQAPSSCSVVDGTISPNGWCMLYSKKS